MAAKEQPETYTPIHKGLRSRLFKTSIQAGKIEYTDEASLNTLYDEFNSLVASIRIHHTMEENFIHPLLADRVPGGAEKLEEEHQTRSIAFEILGPPRLSKLLYEAYLLQLAFGDVASVTKTPAKGIAQKLESLIRGDAQLRAQIISIGIPILLPDGKTLLRGPDIKIPPYRGENELKITEKTLEAWAHDGWVDLRITNMEHWKKRFEIIAEQVRQIPEQDTSSRRLRNKAYWSHFREIDPGKLVGWIFSDEEKGQRMKA